MSYVNLKEVLRNTKNQKFAVGAFNFNGYEDVQGIVNAASQLNAPIIVAASMSVVRYFGLKQIVGMVRGIAEAVDIPVCLHLDHSTSVDLCKEAIVAGFGSVMIDASAKSYEDNIHDTVEVVQFARKYGASVEAEIGHVGGVEDNIVVSKEDALLTNPSDAQKFYEATKVDALAVAIGTAHGFYKKEPKIDFERLQTIRNLVPCHLVLHGGTGVPDKDFKRCVDCGMSKINVGTELKKVYTDTIRNQCAVVSRQEIDPKKLTKQVKTNIEDAVMKKIITFGSDDKI
ncbi:MULTISPECIES: class II fructose-bisphosphate aldolase [Terrabacteria group]|uniref:class II fructose-bisphosphate aldolase n=1 Tax=Bacillati TaxID=1783272 RepID=UPI001C6E5C76|nr:MULTISPECIES: class II fructose-bisphosphate aldolase [Terrabacteria group]MBW9212633.1 class II fructose-bisphosphate aldolase [Trueperella sp. zg.1013]